MPEVQRLSVEAGEDGVRLDRWLRRRWPNLGQTQIHKLARSGQLRVDGARAKADTRLTVGAVVRVPPLMTAAPSEPAETLSHQDVAFARSLVLYEDKHVLVLNKPVGLAVQGGTGTTRHIDRLLSAWGEGPSRPRLTHRLDRDTSGVLALGKSPDAAARLAAAFAERLAEKTYWAIVDGAPQPAIGVIDRPLSKVGFGDRERIETVDRYNELGKPAVSRYVTLALAQSSAAWLALRPLTGRTHQLRAHMLSIGHPILGDTKYYLPRSQQTSGTLKLQLHARRLVLPHPADGMIDVTAPISPAMQAGFARFGFQQSGTDEDPFLGPGRN